MALLTLLAITPAAAQDDDVRPAMDPTPPASREGPKEIVVQLGAGLAVSRLPEPTVPESGEETRFGPSFTARALWRPGYLLGVGVQSGLTRISTLDAGGTTLALTTVPAMLVFAMEHAGFDASLAAGWQRYIVAGGGRTISSAWEMSYIVSAGYAFEVTRGLDLGAELSFGTMPERETGYGAVQLRGTYVFEY